jgi:hypothetical protein
VKKSLFQSIFWFLLTIVFFTIAFPTLVVNFNNNLYRFRGWDPVDLNPEFLLQEFRFFPSLDLQGGNIATLSVDLSDVNEAERETKLEEIKNIIFLRLLKINPGYFELHSSFSAELQEYNLLLKLPEKIDENLLSILISPGQSVFWVEDTSITEEIPEEIAQQDPLAGRKATDLNNEDIASVTIVSDARCYFNDPSAPKNFCLKILFKPDSKSEFIEALYASPTGQVPLLLLVDNFPVAVQAQGQFYSGVTPDRELLLYTVVADTWLANAVLGSIVSDSSLDRNVSLTSINTIDPLLGINTLSNLKMAIFSALIAISVLLYIYFRKRSGFAILAIIIFLIYDIAFMKIFNLVIDLPLIAGFLASFLIYLMFIIYLLYKVRSASSKGLDHIELESAYETVKGYYRNLALVVIIGAFIVSILAPIFVINFYNGLGFGIIIGLVLIYLPIKQLLSVIFLRKEKWLNF